MSKLTHKIKERYSKELKAFGENLKTLRKGKGLTQSDVAHEAGISYANYNYTESGSYNPSLAVILAIAEALEVHPAELLAF